MEAKLAVLGGADSSSNGRMSLEQAAALATHPSWQRSGFEPLERFIFDFLTGGNEAGGARRGSSIDGDNGGGQAGAESVRLKLQVGCQLSSSGPLSQWGSLECGPMPPMPGWLPPATWRHSLLLLQQFWP